MAKVTLKSAEEVSVMREAGRLLASVFSYLDTLIGAANTIISMC